MTAKIEKGDSGCSGWQRGDVKVITGVLEKGLKWGLIHG